jgi:hypothetical protein
MVRCLIERFDSHVAMFSAFGLAVVAAAPGNEAEAVDFVYYQPNSGAGWVIPATIDGLYINVETQVTGITSLSVPGFDINPYSATGLNWFNATGTGMMRYPGVTTGSAGNLPLGTSVSSARSFGSGNVTFGPAAGNWSFNSSNYVGFRFIGGDGGTKYAWLRMDVGATFADRKIMEVGYSTITNQSIIVGQPNFVPEPSTVLMGFLAGGAAGIVAWRRKKLTA